MAALSDLVAAAIRVLPVGGYPREQFVDKSVADIYGCVICTEVRAAAALFKHDARCTECPY